ncbi:60S ribosomal protein L6 [Loa loa]|uniref:Large ribosomal subunit protein eL6 n=1 Tax=Loa loa TaxID=7209 RepID=A0A1S0U766_LOALO|nr:60S ribosomal protein L6 [Loa loa]EFO26256.2 60S ribosomal protein L6 [Loa loa]
MAKKCAPRMRHNYEVTPGVMRFSAARMYAKRGAYAKKPYPAVEKKIERKTKFIVKPIGGDKNGKERKVFIKKRPKYVKEGRTTRRAKRSPKKTVLRRSITPGTILIILAGRHKGKRVIFLKQLEKSGLLLVTGPMKLNSTPLRRIAQAFFKKAPKKGDANIFAQGTTEYTVSDQRKADQKAVDSVVLEVIREHPEKKYLFGYLGSRFALGKNQFPHQMLF